MFKKFFSANTASIKKNSDFNTIIQNSVIENFILCDDNAKMISVLGQSGQHNVIQEQVLKVLDAASKAHPLYPTFSAKLNGDMSQLVSTPETQDAFEKYPRRIKGMLRMDYKKYPHMDKSETLEEYAYRTQEKIKFKTTAYQEYLGDCIDPYPVTQYTDGMTTTIVAQEFPPAVDATISVGSIFIPIKLRRKPCKEYGIMVLGTESDEQGFDFNITVYKDLEKFDIKITKTAGCDLETQLQCERLFNAINQTKSISIMVGTDPFITATIKEEELTASMFEKAPYIVRYLESLLTIERFASCKFDSIIGDVSYDDYRTAIILASSLEGKWTQSKLDFDNEVRCDHDRISADFSGDEDKLSDIVVAVKMPDISLQGVHFMADRYTVVYKDAEINNMASVIQNRKKKRNNILITFRPMSGKNFFSKYCKFEGIQVKV